MLMSIGVKHQRIALFASLWMTMVHSFLSSSLSSSSSSSKLLTLLPSYLNVENTYNYHVFQRSRSMKEKKHVHLYSLTKDDIQEEREEGFSKEKETVSFTSSPMCVFIEDTDAYGIMYNSNYLRAFDRALHMSTIDSSTNSTEHRNLHADHHLSAQHEGWSLVSVGQQRFATSPQLGEDYLIRGRLTNKEFQKEETWDMEMTSLDASIVYNWVKDVKIHVSNDHESLRSSLAAIPQYIVEEIQPNLVCSPDTFSIYRDEIDAHWQGHLPLRNILNLFERSRTNALGGPDGLRRLKEDTDNPVIVVVTGISDFTLVDEGAILVPGQQVYVETMIAVKRRGMILECYQTLKTAEDNLRLAQGKVSLMLLNGTTRRPTARLPSWAQELLNLM